MITSKPLFSVQLGPASQVLAVGEYVQRLLRVQAGIKKLLHPLHLHSHMDHYRRTGEDGLEWMDVHLKEGVQLNFVDELESSIGSRLRLLDIELQAATDATECALQTLRELQIRRTWKSSEFLNFVERRSHSREANALGHGMQADDNSVRIHFPLGKKSEAVVLNRRFSAICVDPVEVTFRPTHVGADRAFVSLSKASMRLICSDLRRIEASWSDTTGQSISDLLFRAARSQSWVSVQCKVVVNGAAKPKAILIQTVMP